MTTTEIMMSAICSQVCGAEKIEYESLSEEQINAVYALSKSHDMAHLVAAELFDAGVMRDGDELGEKFSKQQVLAVYRYEHMNYELEQISELFEEAGIAFIPLKGSVIRKYYPEPWMRTSSDIDVLVREADIETAVRLLVEKEEYEEDNRSEHDISLISPSGVNLELHHGLIEDERANECSRILESVWDHAHAVENSKYHYELSDEMFYFYHIAHMAKHFEVGGCGVKPFADLWILENVLPHDDKKRNELLESSNLLVFADACRSLMRVWLGAEEHNDITARMERYIISGGVYGSVTNRVAVQQGKSKGRMAYVLSRLFLPYDTLRQIFPSLDGHKWLTPLYQVRRWFRLVFKKGRLKTSVAELRTSANVSEELLNDTTELLKSIGL